MQPTEEKNVSQYGILTHFAQLVVHHILEGVHPKQTAKGNYYMCMYMDSDTTQSVATWALTSIRNVHKMLSPVVLSYLPKVIVYFIHTHKVIVYFYTHTQGNSLFFWCLTLAVLNTNHFNIIGSSNYVNYSLFPTLKVSACTQFDN